MAIVLTESADALPIGAVPSAPVFHRDLRLALLAADVYTPGGLLIATPLAAEFPGHTFRGDGMVAGLSGATVRFFEVKTEAVAGVAYSGENGGDGTGPFDLTDNDTLEISVDGGTPQVAQFDTGDFVDIDAATAAEVAAVINADTTGLTAYADANERVIIVSDTKGAGSSIDITAVTGTATVLNFGIGAAGTRVGTAAGVPRLHVFEETGAGVLREVLAATDLSGHTAVDIPVMAV